MSDLGGWLWVIFSVLAIGGLGVAIAYGSSMWLRRGSIAQQGQDAKTRKNYREEELREKSQERLDASLTEPGTQYTENVSIPAKSPGATIKSTTKSRGAVTGHNVRYVLAFALAGTIVAFILISIFL